MKDKIKELIRNESYIQADELIDKELNQSFDFSSVDDRLKYETLNKMKDEILINLSTRSFGYKVENFRSIKGKISASIKPQLYEIKYLAYLKELEKALIGVEKTIIEEETVVKIILTPNFIEYQEYISLLKDAGTKIKTEEDLYLLRAFNKQNQVIIKRTLDGLHEILYLLIEEGKERISIHLPVNKKDISERALFLVLFSILLNTILFIIDTEIQINRKVQVNWSFDEKDVKDLFQKVIAKAKIFKEENRINENKLEVLKKEVLTENKEYIKQLKAIVNIIDEPDVPILILGESGVGKSYLAKAIHKISNRKGKFISLNGLNFTVDLADSLIFGIEKGTATNVPKRKGKVELAEKGTLFIDEVDRIPKMIRDKLLQFIDTKKYLPVGSEETEEIEADVRLIYGTNKDLHKLVDSGEFEEDFLFRINKRIIKIPSLQERKEDVEKIAYAILEELNIRKNTDIGITSEVISELFDSSLRGNFRTVERIIEHGYYEAKAQDKYGIISSEHYENYIPDEYKNTRELNQLKSLAKSLMLDYENLKSRLKKDDDKFLMMENLILPIFAHIFLKEIYQDKSGSWRDKNSLQICGSSASRGKEATIIKREEEYQRIKKLI